MLSCVAAVYDREMAPYRAVLADDAKTVGFGEATTFCADAWTASVESQVEAFSGAQHLMSPQSATVSGDRHHISSNPRADASRGESRRRRHVRPEGALFDQLLAHQRRSEKLPAMSLSSGVPSKPSDNTEMPLRAAASLSPALRLSVIHFTVALLACWMGSGQAAESWPLVVTADRSDQCAEALTKGRQQERAEGFAASFSMLNWNVEKAQHPESVTAFTAFAERSDLIFLQEAVPLKKTATVIAQSLYEAFVRGYVQDEIDTGVLTLARAPHLVHCHLLATEPWLRTPKATSVTLYPLAGSDASLLTVNLHAVNFSFGVKAYRAQLEAAAELMRAHKGPIIFGGDLNTWSERRQDTLDALTKELGLLAVTFSPDHRTSRFGRPLDHLYVRGLTWQSSETVQVETSDHNPLIVTLQKQDS